MWNKIFPFNVFMPVEGNESQQLRAWTHNYLLRHHLIDAAIRWAFFGVLVILVANWLEKSGHQLLSAPFYVAFALDFTAIFVLLVMYIFMSRETPP